MRADYATSDLISKVNAEWINEVLVNREHDRADPVNDVPGSDFADDVHGTNNGASDLRLRREFARKRTILLQRGSGRMDHHEPDITAMPFGLDTPSTIGMALLVLGPAFAKFRAAGLDPTSAGLETWYLGMAATATMGVFKLFLSFAGRTVRRLIPMAGLLGSLAGIALTLIGFFPMVDLLQFPIVGFLTLGLILYALVAKGSIPLRMPGVLFAVMVGTVLYYGAGHFGFLGMQIPAPAIPALRLAFPHPDPGIFHGFAALWDYLPLIIPFALLTVVGGVNNTESARVAGDELARPGAGRPKGRSSCLKSLQFPKSSNSSKVKFG